MRFSQGRTVGQACREMGITEQTYYRWRKEYGGMNRDQLMRLKELENEYQRLKRVVADLSLDKKILTEGARGTEGPRSEAIKSFPSPIARQSIAKQSAERGDASIMCGKPSAYLSAEFAAHSANIVLRSVRRHMAC